MRLDKPIGALLLLWPAMWGLWLAKYGFPDPDLLLIFIFGVLLTRSAGCIINDLADRDFDPHVERTRERPLATGRVKPAEALALAAALLLTAFVLALHLNRTAILLSVIALVLMVVYPYLKRFFVFPQAWLGVAFGFAIPMAFAAQYGRLPAVAWVLLLANVFWAIAYDTEYAMVDRDDDVKLGLKSSAILLGRHDVTGVMVAHGFFLVTMAGIGYWQFLGILYYAGLAAAAVLVIHQYQLIEDRTREGSFRAFRNNNFVGLAIWAGLALDLALRIRIK
ncbi:MAG: 4-hydroxybenzoate octaprenyltransferase [Burkholderiales bacterium]|nr:4-hydroxybenzoate octaprenyltransferase [Burkholderiales bacterium]